MHIEPCYCHLKIKILSYHQRKRKLVSQQQQTGLHSLEKQKISLKNYANSITIKEINYAQWNKQKLKYFCLFISNLN